eukprot:GILK01001093.1.p1 GENE.GILK01001093.1~~GILK01001093.1.p1  ORF type:complete len:299 (+),score=57.11 GILK01001093.1:37-897(+)
MADIEKKWGDLDDEADYSALKTRIESSVDAEGYKTIIEYKTNDKGQKVKVTKKVRLVQEEVRLNKAVEERKKWQKFGLAAGAAPGLEDGITYSSYDEVYVEAPKTKAEAEQPDELSKSSVVVCRICGKQGDHWTLKCPYKDNPELLRQEQASGRINEDSKSRLATIDEKPMPGKYVPPSMRGKGGAVPGGDARDDRGRDETSTVRVTNLSEDVHESDLYELFQPFGSISRIFLAKDKVTNVSKGFAFINFVNKEDAQKAIYKLNGHGYDHLILQVEWAKPSAPRDR